MEEQKKNSKEVKMQPINGMQGEQEGQKLTYDQLKEIADKLFNENKYLRHQLQQATEFANTINRLDYLFKVVELMSDVTSCWHFSDDFTSKCIAEIEKVMTVPEQTETEGKEGA